LESDGTRPQCRAIDAQDPRALNRTIHFMGFVILFLSLMATEPAQARRPVALGVASEPSTDMTAVDAFQAWSRARPALWTLWSSWGDREGDTKCRGRLGTCAFPAEAARGLRARGITPLITWQPTDPANAAAGAYERYRNIIVGRHDRYIRGWAKAARKFRAPVIVRFAHEMNGTWFPWSLTSFDNSPRRFVKAWRHIVTIFRNAGARNVKFLWTPFQRCSTCSGYRYELFYPGNGYVDYVGVTALNWGESGWISLLELVNKPLAILRRITRTRGDRLGKPVILPEIGCHWMGGDKAAWLREGYVAVRRRWRSIRAMVYFDYDTTFAAQPDWRLAMPPDRTALRAYRFLAAKPAFRGRLP